MNAQERVAVLEGLLARVRLKAAEPRVLATAAAPVAAPQMITPVAPPVAAASVAPFPVTPEAIAPADQSIDDLLEAPIPIIHAAPSDKPSVQPISMPGRALPHVAPPEFGARIEAEEAPIPLVTSAPALTPVQEVEEYGAEELGEDDLISVPPGPRESVAPAPEITATAAEDDLDFDEEDEDEMPASSKRPISTPSLEAVAEREFPLKTPPPESGPQEALPPPAIFEAPRLPEIRETFGSDVGVRAELGPTPEQLGDTIDLPEPSRAPLELDVAAAPVVPIDIEPPPVSEELEVTLPRRESVGVYDAGLTPPADARDELRRYEEQAAPLEPAAPAEASGIVSRPELSGVVVSRFSAAARTFAPKSFVELLDASLGLGSD